jgi:anti-sigma regulatory factor (Ser/Thr protein kinase)
MTAEAAVMVKHVHGVFEASADAPGRARLLVGDALIRWGLEYDELRDAVLLLTSELVTNAIRHCRRRVQLHVHFERETFRVEVVDDSPLPPGRVNSYPFAEKGRGLRIVESLSSGWGVTPDVAGKRVWFELGVPAPPAAPATL